MGGAVGICRFIYTISMAIVLAGCGSVGSAVDGRSITGKCLIYATLCCNGREANVDLDGKKVQVTTSQITWDGGGSLNLPANWSRLELAEPFDSLVVNVDGRRFASIPPVK
jgi:hypothetical protein